MSIQDDIRYQAYFGDEYANRYDRRLTSVEMSREMTKVAKNKEKKLGMFNSIIQKIRKSNVQCFMFH